MNKLFLSLLCLIAFFIWGNARAFEGYVTPQKEKEPEIPMSYCPEKKIYGKLSDCLMCHTTPNFKVKESNIEEGYNLPSDASLIFRGDKPILTYKISTINAVLFEKFYNYLTWHPKIKVIRLEIDSYGGSLFASKNIVGYMDESKANGGIIETVVRGKAMSAGLIVFLNGTKGSRYIAESAELMWHELFSFKFFAIETPSSSEQEAETLRHLQDTTNQWIAERSKLTKKQIDKLVHKKELWCNGREAVEKFGFADKLIQ